MAQKKTASQIEIKSSNKNVPCILNQIGLSFRLINHIIIISLTRALN